MLYWKHSTVLLYLIFSVVVSSFLDESAEP